MNIGDLIYDFCIMNKVPIIISSVIFLIVFLLMALKPEKELNDND